MTEQRLSLTKLLAEDPRLDIDSKLAELRRELTAEVHRVDVGANVTAEIHDQVLTVNATPGKAGARERGRLDQAVKAVTDQWYHELTELITGQDGITGR